MPGRTVELAASELQTFINTLPRLLTEVLTITVLGGSCGPGDLSIQNFYGPGQLTVKAAEGAQVQLSRIAAHYNHAILNLDGLNLQWASEILLEVYQSDLRLKNCSFLGAGGKPTGIATYAMSRIEVITCTFQNLDNAILAGESSIVSVIDCAASGNNTGAYVWNGGIIFLNGSTPDLVGGAANAKGGGIITKRDGTLL